MNKDLTKVLTLVNSLFVDLANTRTAKSGGLLSKKKSYSLLIKKSTNSTNNDLAKFYYNFALYVKKVKAIDMQKKLFDDLENNFLIEINNYQNYDLFCNYLSNFEFNK